MGQNKLLLQIKAYSNRIQSMYAIVRTKGGEAGGRKAHHVWPIILIWGSTLVTLLQSYMPLERRNGSMKLSTWRGREGG